MATKTTAKKPARATRSRATLKEEFDSIEEQQQAHEEQDATASTAARNRADQVRNLVKGLTVEDVAQRLITAKLDTARAIDNISEQLIAKTQELEAVTEAVALESRELEELHGKDVIASSKQVLIADYKATEASLEEQAEQHKKQIAQQLNEAKANFAAHEQQARTSWEREKAEYTYTLVQLRKKDQDAYEEQKRVRQIADGEEARIRLLGWTQREDALSGKEQHVTKLETQVAGHAEEIRKEVSRAEAIVRNTVTRDLTHQIEMLQAKHGAEKQVLEGEKKALAEANVKLSAQVAALQTQLEKANETIQNLGSNALQSASGQAALIALQQSLQNGNGTAKSQKTS